MPIWHLNCLLLIHIDKMNDDVFLILKTDTQDILSLLFSLRRFYVKNRYRVAVREVNDSIITSGVALMMIDRELARLNSVSVFN